MTASLTIKLQAYGGLLLLAVLSQSQVRELLEASPTLHMVVQLPALVFGGLLLGAAYPAKLKNLAAGFGFGNLSLLFMAISILLFWMIPRSLDAALDDSAYELWKFVSLPLLAGLPLRMCWTGLASVARGFISAQFIAMLAYLGWLYAASPIRICNNYLADEQKILGWNLLLIAAALAVTLGLRFLVGDAGNENNPPTLPPQKSRSFANVC